MARRLPATLLRLLPALLLLGLVVALNMAMRQEEIATLLALLPALAWGLPKLPVAGLSTLDRGGNAARGMTGAVMEKSTILLVEDEPAIRENYAGLFRRQGFHVDTYDERASASAALKVRVIGDCPGALVGALAAIPKLDLSDAPGQPADLLVACAAAGALPQTDTAAMFFVTPESQPQQFRKPVWSTLAGPLQNIALEEVAAEVVDRPVGTAATPVLSSGRGALISLHREADRAPAV